jgi:hypothetical protein
MCCAYFSYYHFWLHIHICNEKKCSHTLSMAYTVKFSHSSRSNTFGFTSYPNCFNSDPTSANHFVVPAGRWLDSHYSFPNIKPLNGSVVFLKKADIVLTNDEWRIVVNINLSTYQEVASVIRTDLRLNDRGKSSPQFPNLNRLKHI